MKITNVYMKYSRMWEYSVDRSTFLWYYNRVKTGMKGLLHKTVLPLSFFFYVKEILEELTMTKNLFYDIHDRPKLGQLIIFAIQQLLAIMAATIAVPAIVGNGMSASAALFGAGVGTIVYQLFTRFKSPVFLGSSFAFIGPMLAAFAGATSAKLGYLGRLGIHYHRTGC